MAKKIQAYVKLQIPAGKANPSPPVGPALGQNGVNIMEFCKQFNAATQKLEPGIPTPVVITVYSDRSFTFITKTPPATVLIKKELGMKIEGKPGSGSKRPNKDKVGTITQAQLRKLAELRIQNTNAASIDAAIRSLAGTARSMGVDVVG